MISDFAHDIQARAAERTELDLQIAAYLAQGGLITCLDPEPEPEAVHAEWMNNSRRAKLMIAREKRRKPAHGDRTQAA
ncbi:hypothetical protein [Pseudomonas sp. GM_Psu_2]|uniref:hypothetical protein n=1 Tax=unclassified Pseudomonas TaxID=196821 RepID=UPI00226A2DF1|nr:hypothetical protein [Pseudomonas sp. GM_Psu_2]